MPELDERAALLLLEPHGHAVAKLAAGVQTPVQEVTRPSTVTLARDTRCSTIRIGGKNSKNK